MHHLGNITLVTLFSTIQLSHPAVLEFVVRRNLPEQAEAVAALVHQLVGRLGYSALTANLLSFARSVAYVFCS